MAHNEFMGFLGKGQEEFAFVCNPAPETGESGFDFCYVTTPNLSVQPRLIMKGLGLDFLTFSSEAAENK